MIVAESYLALLLVAALCACLVAGYPVAFTLAGVSILFAFLGAALGAFDLALLYTLPSRIFGIFNNSTLTAVPLFVFMGSVLEKSGIAEDLLSAISDASRNVPGGLAFGVLLVGTLLAASTGIVGATVVTLSLLALPTLIRRGYPHDLASGTVAATGTLGQLIPPSVALILLADVMASSYQQAQLQQGIFNLQTLSVGQLFMGALLPGLVLVGMYGLYLGIRMVRTPLDADLPQGALAKNAIATIDLTGLMQSMLPPTVLIILVLGSILAGIATPTEAAGVGAFGAVLLALMRRKWNVAVWAGCSRSTLTTTSMVFTILIGASVFSLVFRGLGGDALVEQLFTNIPGGTVAAIVLVMLVVFILGFILDFIEITYVVLPIVAPVILSLGVDPVWFAVMIAVNLQTSFLTPPFGFALFYMRSVAPAEIQTPSIYKGVIPFIGIQLLLLVLLALFPQIATWLPMQVYGN
ncbi:MAG: TRAP transporter large permease [Gammaproteobacteria bacterium]